MSHTRTVPSRAPETIFSASPSRHTTGAPEIAKSAAEGQHAKWKKAMETTARSGGVIDGQRRLNEQTNRERQQRDHAIGTKAHVTNNAQFPFVRTIGSELPLENAE
eukprot:4325551-Pleurochrysis_carterae.AAC.6